MISGGLSLVTHASKLGATGPIVSTRPLVALALASDKNDLFSTKGEYFIFCLLWLCTEVSSGVSELQVGTIITNPTKIIFAFLVCHILTLRGDLLFPTLAIVVSKQGFTLCAQMIKTLQHAYSLQSRPFGLKFGPGDLREHLPFGHAAVSWAKNLIDLKLLFLFIIVCESLIIIHYCLWPVCIPSTGRSSRSPGRARSPRAGTCRASRAPGPAPWEPPRNTRLYSPWANGSTQHNGQINPVLPSILLSNWLVFDLGLIQRGRADLGQELLKVLLRNSC